MAPSYRIRLLGSLQIEKEGTPLPALRTQKSAALLAYLIRQGQPVLRSHLAGLFWGDNSEERGRRNLSNELSHLVGHFPDLFEADRQAICFRPSEAVWIDLTAFESLIRQSSTGAGEHGSQGVFTPTPSHSHTPVALLNLAEALALYRGDFMAGATLNDCPDFETWLLAEQEYWRQRVAEALDRLINHHLQQGEETQSQTYARRWLALEPWREEAHRYLMIALARSGQRSAALAQFENCRRLLAEELAVEPSPETMALVEQIRRGELSRPRPEAPPSTSSTRRLRTPLRQAQETLQEALQDGPPSLAPPPVSTDRCNQLLLLNKVKNFWVNGVLEQSLQDVTRLALSRQSYPSAIEHPWAQVVEPLLHKPEPVPSEKSMLDLYHEADRALLILGPPGAGKTIALLELARDLISLAEADPGCPIPVILNLSSWSEQREALPDWVVEELAIKYQIPRQMGRAWLDNNQLLLLLDGFDEIAPKYYAAGRQTLNQFRESHGLTGLVVCSRLDSYEVMSLRLRLGGAVLLQRLNLAQIDHYLAGPGNQLDFLRVALKQEADYGGSDLRQLLESPLMLSVIRLAYQESGPAEAEEVKRIRSESKVVLTAPQDGDSRRRHLFAAYVQRMLQRRGGSPAYPSDQTEAWLTWLAQKMFQHNQAVFLIEQLQPSWLASRGYRWLYLLGYRLIEAVGIGLAIWALVLFWQQYRPQVALQGPSLLTVWLPLPPGYADFATAMLIALGFSLLIALIDGLYFEWLERRNDTSLRPILSLWRHFTIAGLVGGLTAATILAISPGSLWVALYWAVMGGAGFGILSYWAHEQSFQQALQPAEALRWSWPEALKWTLIGLITGGVLQIIVWQLQAAFVGAALIWLVSFFLVGGLQGRGVEAKTGANQGIWLAGKNGLLTGLLAGGVVGLAIWSFSNLLIGAWFGLASFIFWGLFYGGSNLVKHFLIRWLLWANGDIPWNYPQFLDYAAGRVLLRKVGSGYIFMHRLLQAYFANLASAGPAHPPPSDQAADPKQRRSLVTGEQPSTSAA